MKLHRFFILLLAIACLLSAESLSKDEILEPSNPLNYIKQPFDVLEYNPIIDLTTIPTKDIVGKNIVRVLWTGEPDTSMFYFHLEALDIDSILINGTKAQYGFNDSEDNSNSYYSVSLPDDLNLGDTSAIEIFYHGLMTSEAGGYSWGGVHTSEGVVYALGVGFHNSYVSATRHWMPCYDHPSDKAKFKTSIKVNKEHYAVSTGLLQSIEEDGEYLIYNWEHAFECSTYLLTFAAGNLIELEFDNYKDISVRGYSNPEDSTASRYAYKSLHMMLEAYEHYFGAYPFDKIGYVNTSKGAMEHQTLVSFPTFLVRNIYSKKDSLNLTIAHELSHQWFGDMVSPEDFRDAWLNEGFAVFCEAILLEYYFGKTEYFNKLKDERRDYLKSTVKNEGILPIYDFDRKSPSSNYPATIYQKGALVVGMLRYELGDSLFFEAIRGYLEEYSYGITNTNNLYEMIKGKTGKDIEWFFRQWVYGKGWPRLDVRFTITPIGKDMYLTVDAEQIQSDSIGIFNNVPLEIEVVHNNGNDTLITVLNINDKYHIESLSPMTGITDVRVSNIHKVCALIEYNEEITSVENFPLNGEFSIFPNPAKDIIFIPALGLNTEPEIAVFDQLGNTIILSNKIKSYLSDIRLDVSDLNNGIYYLILSSGSVRKYAKFSVCK